MIYDKEEKRWYLNEFHRKSSKAQRKEMESWGTYYASLEDAKKQWEEMRNSKKKS